MQGFAPVAGYSHAQSYAERVLVAHFAIMLVGLVAMMGVWRDSSLSFGLIAAASALMALVAWVLTWWGRARLAPVQQHMCRCCVRVDADPRAWHSVTFFLRRANRLAGPPTWFVLPFVQGERLKHSRASNAHLFVFAASPWVPAACVRGSARCAFNRCGG